MVVVFKASDTPTRAIDVEVNYRTVRRNSLAFLLFSVHLLLLIENSLQLKTRVPVVCLDLIQIQIFNLVSRQEKVVLILTIKSN